MTKHLMLMSKDSRVATTLELVALNKAAIEFGATRVLDEYALLNLDENGLHVLTHMFLFWHPFRRCEVAMKVDGDPFPHVAVLDLQDEWYDSLTTLGDYRTAQEYYKRNPRRVDE